MTYKMYYADWCRNCPSVKELIKSYDIEGKYGDFINADNHMDECKRLNITTVPTVLFYEGGKEVCRLQDPCEIKQFLSEPN